MKRTLILYYSHSNGNTKSLAEDLQKATGGDLAAIETEKPHRFLRRDRKRSTG